MEIKISIKIQFSDIENLNTLIKVAGGYPAMVRYLCEKGLDDPKGTSRANEMKWRNRLVPKLSGLYNKVYIQYALLYLNEVQDIIPKVSEIAKKYNIKLPNTAKCQK